MQNSTSDKKLMQRALHLARKGAGHVSPNPMVGAVLVKDGRIIGEGYHQKFGQAHAEVNAITSAKESVKNATLYCTLEPCCHTDKKTPPCAQRIVEEGVARVIVASKDPNPQVSGKGIALLRSAGIEVVTGICDAENRALNRFFFKYIVTGLPYISLKIAQTLDGKITQNRGEQNWITNERSQKLVHQWRAEYDAVLVGANTIRIDDPELTVRRVKGRNPKRIVISNSMQLPLKSKIFTQTAHAATYIVSTDSEAGIEQHGNKHPNVRYLQTDSQGSLNENILKLLARENIASIIVEGGQQIFSYFLSAAIADEINVLIAPKIFGLGVRAYAGSIVDFTQNYALDKIKQLDDDVLICFRKR